MSMPYDAASKELLERDPLSWLIYAGLTPNGPVRVIDADLSTVTAEADKVFLVEAPEPWIAHFEIQSSRDISLPERILRYYVLLWGRHKLPIRSVAILLRPQADGPELSGRLRLGFPDEPSSLEFSYHVIRTWSQPVEKFLEGGLGTLPLALLSDVKEREIGEIVRLVNERIRRESSVDEAKTLEAATIVLMGLRFSKLIVRQLFEGGLKMGFHGLEDSWTYQWLKEGGFDKPEAMDGAVKGLLKGFVEGYETGIKEGKLKGAIKGEGEGRVEGRVEGLVEGRLEELRKIILRQGQKRFGEPTDETRSAIEVMSDIERLEALTERLLDVSRWDELVENA